MSYQNSDVYGLSRFIDIRMGAPPVVALRRLYLHSLAVQLGRIWREL